LDTESLITDEAEKITANSNFGKAIKMSFCKGLMHGTIEKYLQDLHIPVNTSTESTEPPELIKN
jgi:hypothetical protein